MPFRVYPACAGIDHCLAFYIAKRGGLPRMRGDRPYAQQLRDEKAQFTPHARGSTSEGTEKGDKPKVYPACAGIDLRTIQATLQNFCLPRMRGDRPKNSCRKRLTFLFTPHARGSTVSFRDCLEPKLVYPACAGIDPQKELRAAAARRLPRMRGDRPPDTK